MPRILVTAPESEPVSISEAKAHLRVTFSDEDTYIDSLVKTARRQAEKYCRRAFITQTWDLVLDGFPCGSIEVPLPPLQSVTSITYVDTNGATQTLASGNYTVDTKSNPARITPAYGKVWPTTQSHINVVTVRFVAGYGSSTDVPDDIGHALKLMIGHWYENREDTIAAADIKEVPKTSMWILDAYRLPEIA